MTSMIHKQLIETLRRPDCWSAAFHGCGGFLADAAEAAPFQAAAALEALTVRNAELERVIAEIAEYAGGNFRACQGSFDHIASLAGAASAERIRKEVSMKQSSAMSDERPADDAALIAELHTGKRKCPSLEPTLSERPHSSDEWRELGIQASDRITTLNAELSERDKEVERLRGALKQAGLAFNRIAQGTSPKRAAAIAKSNAFGIRELLGCEAHGVPFITPGICPFCADDEALSTPSRGGRDAG